MVWGIGGGMGGLGDYQARAERMRQEALAARGFSEEEIAATGTGPAAISISAKRKFEKEELAKSKARRAALEPPPPPLKSWYGHPRRLYAAQNLLSAIRANQEHAAAIQGFERAGGGNALAAVIEEWGPSVLKTIPGMSEVMAALDIASEIPIIGDIVSEIGGVLIDIPGEVLDIVGDIPVVSEVIGTAKKIPVVGDLLDVFF